MEIINRLVELSFIGKISPIPSISDGLPYQHSGKSRTIIVSISLPNLLLKTF